MVIRMKLESLKCPSCGSPYNPSTIQCEYCRSYIIMSNKNYEKFNEEQFLDDTDNEEYKGIYVHGTLLGKGEKPINLGAANYLDGIAKGGMLLLTNKSLSFSSHKFFQEKKDLVIKLKDIANANVAFNMLISQTIAIDTKDKTYKFVVNHGNEWVENILEAKNNVKDDTALKDDTTLKSDDYIEELQRLKKLLDEGIITKEEFDIKKRMLLNI